MVVFLPFIVKFFAYSTVINLITLDIMRLPMLIVPFRATSTQLAARVNDPDDWIRLSSNSLERITGKTLYETIHVETAQQVHENERYAVLSHDTAGDPVYNYGNRAAVEVFKWPEDEFYQLPSRYSAPDGTIRNSRSTDIQDAIDSDLKTIALAIRQTKHGELFQLTDVMLWNVYDDDGHRVGQTAIYDRNLVVPYDKD